MMLIRKVVQTCKSSTSLTWTKVDFLKKKQASLNIEKLTFFSVKLVEDQYNCNFLSMQPHLTFI